MNKPNLVVVWQAPLLQKTLHFSAGEEPWYEANLADIVGTMTMALTNIKAWVAHQLCLKYTQKV